MERSEHKGGEAEGETAAEYRAEWTELEAGTVDIGGPRDVFGLGEF